MAPPPELQETLEECLTSHPINSIEGSPVRICNLLGESGAVPIVPNYSNQPPPWDMAGNPEETSGWMALRQQLANAVSKSSCRVLKGFLASLSRPISMALGLCKKRCILARLSKRSFGTSFRL